MLFPKLANNPNKDPKIGFVEKFSYGLGDFASQMLYTPTGSILIYYYTEVVGVNIATVATIMLISRFFDGFSDLFMGYMIEHTKSPYGKARAWLIRMLIPFFIAMVALFSVPSGMSDWLKYVYIFVSYNFAITVVYTAINLPYGSMSTTMTQDSYQRSIIVIYRMLLATAGNTVTMAVTLPMVDFFGGSQMAWTITFMILGGVACFCFFLTFCFCHERVASPPLDHTGAKDTLRIIGRMFHNKYWIMLTLAMLTIFSADVVFSTANTYYCRYYLDNPNLIGTFAVIMNGFKIGSMVLILPILLRTIGKRNALGIASFLIFFALLARMIAPENATLAFVAAAFFGFGQGFTYACLFAMLPDTVEYGEYIEKERHEGLIYAGASFGMKLAAGLGAVIASMVMNFGGYINNAETQTPEAMDAILYATTAVPAVLYVLGLLSIAGYGLDKIYPKILQELQRRKVEAAAAKGIQSAEPAVNLDKADNA
ncbi:MAG: glycoside-pentoside-hexuronide (GPH):cation symporter [Candidatus Anaerobiospirillum pullicola]|uniref:Glycoside-pentoside-hexuronide (GPH):cation symporter n=1 Tax=Candidatus Anaerobiospirillum pullicola TaxID=2838451 RepID=A0A948TF70_9GAMM|nr:glycoside-pentoside-hexuronide (GPH):cation symporter [Candidatus Anaerobiospirillum pullicola]